VSTPLRKSAPRKRRARGSISADEILQGAYDLASEESLDALSMPRLAQRLDVGVTSIYWYFRSKEELLDTMTERAMAEFDRAMEISGDLRWDDYLRTYFTEFREVFRRNGLLCDLIVMRTGNLTDEATRIAAQRIETVLGRLVAAGFSGDSAAYAYASLSVYTRGALFLERNWAASARPAVMAPGAFGDTPGLTVLTSVQERHHLSMTGEEDFRFGLENAIRGLRVLLEDDTAEPCIVAARTAAPAGLVGP
jgi:AcrR family transcriptional regulator